MTIDGAVPAEWLEALRAALPRLHAETRGIAFAPLAELAAALPDGSALTLDFAASRRLGAPLVLWRPPGGPTAPPPRTRDRLATLTARERDVAACLAAGASNKAIARRLGIALGTVKDHVHSILKKSGCNSRAAFAAVHAPDAPGLGPRAL